MPEMRLERTRRAYREREHSTPGPILRDSYWYRSIRATAGQWLEAERTFIAQVEADNDANASR